MCIQTIKSVGVKEYASELWTSIKEIDGGKILSSASELLEENIEARDAEDVTEDGADATGREAGAGAAGETEAAGPDAEASATAAAQA